MNDVIQYYYQEKNWKHFQNWTFEIRAKHRETNKICDFEEKNLQKVQHRNLLFHIRKNK